MNHALRSTLLPLLLLPLGACVAQSRYDDALAETKYFQRQYQDLAAFHGTLEADNERLRGELALYQGKAPIEAAATQDIDARLERLKQMTEAIGTAAGVAPGDVEYVAVAGGYGVRVTDAVLFDSGSAEIKPEGLTVLAKVVEQISSQPYERIWVRGHTDSDPVKQPTTVARFPHGNLQLSAVRAVEVAAFLEKKGLQSDKLVVAGFGPTEPVAPNKDADSKRRNRRVEIFVLDDKTAPQH
jgi:chemotaxis protein MotB